jgi:hypothetical protein
MSMGNSTENAILLLIFNATAWADMAQNDGSSPATTITVALHTSDPGEGGTQSTNEISYTGYSRLAPNRDSGAWTVTDNSVSPAAALTFGEMTAGAGGTVTHFSVGTGVSNFLLFSGTVTPNIVVANGVIPQLTTASAITLD